MIKTLASLCLISIVLPSVANAGEDRSASQLLPSSCVLYAQITDPAELVETIVEHPIRYQIEQLPQWQQATEQEQYKKFIAGRQFFELQMKMNWKEATKALTAGGIYAAVDAQTEAVILLVQADNAKTMKRFQDKLLVLTQLGKTYKESQKARYRDVQAYEVDQSLVAVFDNWLLATNRPEAGKAVIDRWLDHGDECLASNESFQKASPENADALSGWGWADLQTLRTAGVAKKLFSGKTDNPAAELLVGGIMSTLTKTPHATLELETSTDGLSLSLQAPHHPEWVPEERAFYFGPDSTGRGPQLASIPGTLLTVSTYRDIGEMWLRAGDLFNERINDQFAEADASLTTLFAGKDFGEDILGSLTPEIAFIATRQSFENQLPRPAIKLPAFALIAQMKNPEKMTRELRRTFQSMIGFFNVIGAMEGRAQLEMAMDKRDDGSETVTTTYIPEPEEEQSTSADLIFNFSPSIGFQNSTVIVSSSQSLVNQLLSHDCVTGAGPSNSVAHVQAETLQQVLEDNQEQLISQNMLEDGNSREEAEVAISLLLQAVGLIQDVSASLNVEQEHLSFDLNLKLTSQPSGPSPDAISR